MVRGSAQTAGEAPRGDGEGDEYGREVDAVLARAYPDARCALDHSGPFELLVATVLSAQTTDERVNTVTPELFRRWPTPEDLAGADPDEVREVVRTLGFQARRATQLVGLAAALVHDHAGEVPPDRDALVALPGVGRKTAHVVLGNAFDVPAITVDTHVGRLARRLGLSRETSSPAVEKDLARALPERDWTFACHRLIAHGRAVCTSRAPACGSCVLRGLCPRVGVA
ncbi:endonuclease III [Georgenia sp. Z1491]|uniref:endonuclease III n=1 Tax=Georgenia sp. Z1491 TaxID=3416707 RepID=UPI003CEBD2E7